MGKIGGRKISKKCFHRDDNSLDQSGGASGGEKGSVEGFLYLYILKMY